MKPFEEGWEKLSNEERLDVWLEKNKKEMGERFADYQEFLENFCISCPNPDMGDYCNFRNDIKLYKFKDGILLLDGFMAMYNVSGSLLELRSIKVIDPKRN